MHFGSEVHFFIMKCIEITKYIESWAPKGAAWQKDNVGLQIGSLNRQIKNILLCLELTEQALVFALKNKCNLIITHHPFLFNSLKNINTDSNNSKIIEQLIKNDVTLYSAHTNLDFTKGGVSFQLAERLELKKINFIENLESTKCKFVVFVPESSVQSVSQAIFENGGGVINEYSNCSFQSAGKGTFKGSSSSNPAIGSKRKFEEVDEIKLEVLINTWDINNILSAVKKVHPYEEIAYDLIPLKNNNVNFGAGAYGYLKQSMPVKEFLDFTQRKLKLKNFRYTLGNKKRINKVAVCGGSCSDLLNKVISLDADAFITADVKYHTFHDANNRILLIDAGHYETEIFILDEIKKRLTDFVNSSSIKIFKYNKTTNPINFYKH